MPEPLTLQDNAYGMIRWKQEADGYGRVTTLMSEFLPLENIPAIETARRRTLRVGARLERERLQLRAVLPISERLRRRRSLC